MHKLGQHHIGTSAHSNLRRSPVFGLHRLVVGDCLIGRLVLARVSG